MNSAKLPFGELREQAIALRRAGKSRREIKQLLGMGSNATLSQALAGEPPPEWTRRPRAKDGLRDRARELRGQGLDYQEIATELGVSKSSVSLWVRDLPVPARLSYAECRQRAAEGTRRYWVRERAAREASRAAVQAAATAEIGALSGREIVIAGAIAYWCEGTKNKGAKGQDRVVFINSDPGLILLFLRFLGTVGIPPEQVSYRLHIHETADVDAAQRFWLDTTGADPEQFLRPTLKRHNPLTNRTNVGERYHGCLRVEVRRGSALYRQIEGWARAATGVQEAADAPQVHSVPAVPAEVPTSSSAEP